MKEYCVGFLFEKETEEVLLVRKNKPEWQKGKLNGIGGKLNHDETPFEGMIREFKEETGLEVRDWKEFCCLKFDGVRVYFFKSFSGRQLYKFRGKENDIGEILENRIALSITPTITPESNVIDNLYWLIPMAIYWYEGQRV